MPYFSSKSRVQLDTCCASLQLIMDEAIKYYDFSITCGYRGEIDQNKAFNDGKSELKFPHSKHNVYPSRAVDIAPYPIDWEDINRFYKLSGIIETIAQQNNINIRWGGNWNSKDYVHFELKEGS
jgi:peptidoglycan L-alanyl-D-glutamate endopeptidase CwlK